MKKFFYTFLLFSIISLVFLFGNNLYADNFTAIVVTNQSYIYKSIDYSDINIFDIYDDDNSINNLLFIAKEDDEFEVCEEIEKQISINSQNVKYIFYKIDIDSFNLKYQTTYQNETIPGENFAYILKYQTMNKNLSSPKIILDTNASIKDKKNADVYEYKITTNTYEKNNIVLQSGTKIKLIDGYNNDLKYTRIQYTDSNGNIKTVYIETENIKVSKISITTICAIILIFVTISVALILLGVKGKNSKKIIKKRKKM